MLLYAETVVRRRHAVVLALRLGALAVALAGLGHVTAIFAREIVMPPVRLNGPVGFDVRMMVRQVLLVAPAYALPALTLALGSLRIARWVVPTSGPHCPTCGYSLKGLKGTTCPECGTSLR